MPEIRIGLLWHSLGHGNLGVDALSRSNIHLLRRAAARCGLTPNFVLFGSKSLDRNFPEGISEAPRPRMKYIWSRNTGFSKALTACDLLVDISEGDSFTDIYGLFRFFLQSSTKWAALRTGNPFVLAPQTIGPFNKWWSIIFAKLLLRRTRLVVARDVLSLDVAQELDRTGSPIETIDVAFALPFERLALGDTTINIGLNISGLMYRAGANFGLSVDYVALTRALIERFSHVQNAKVWLVPHVLVEGALDDDVAVCRALLQEYPYLMAAPCFTDSVKAKSFISGLDFFSGARMHACIGAFSSGVAVAPIAYSRKFNGLFQTLGYSRFVDGRADSTEVAVDKVMKAFDERDVAREEINRSLAIAKERLAKYEDAIVGLLDGLRKN